MKRTWMLTLMGLMLVCVLALAGCQAQGDQNASAESVPAPEETQTPAESGDTASTDAEADETDTHPTYEWPTLMNAVSIRIGRNGQTEYAINMYDHDATATMLNYLSNNGLLFPTYTYEEEVGFVAQSIRGSYSRDDEVTVADIHVGEVYLFSGGQLRLYFKDVPGANITATPVGYVSETETLTQAIQDAYTSNLNDTWGVDVYFWITKQ